MRRKRKEGNKERRKVRNGNHEGKKLVKVRERKERTRHIFHLP